MLTTGDTSKLLGVTSQTIINWMESGKLPFVRVGKGRRKILPRQIKAFVEEHGLPVEGLDPELWAMVSAESEPEPVSADPPLLFLNANGTAIHWSQSARERFGWATNEVLGKPPSTLPARVPGLPVDLMDLAMPSGSETFRTLLLELQTKDGHWLATELSVSWIYDSRGAVVGTVLLLESPKPTSGAARR